MPARLALIFSYGVFLAEKRENDFVPVHILLNEKETEDVLSKMNLRRDNLPKLLSEDPQVKKIGAKAGQVLKIYRKDGEHEYEYYRTVVDA